MTVRIPACAIATLGALCLATLGLNDPASAQFTTSSTFVSADGNDSANASNGCLHDAPCRSLGAALAQTFDGGIVTCLDSNVQGTITITISVTIDCSQTTSAVVSQNGNNGINIAAAGKNVVLRGLVIRGGAVESGTPGTIGVNITQASTVQIDNCKIHGMASGAAQGISFAPAGAAKLFVTDTLISHSGTGVTGGGIVVKPQPGGTAQVVLNRVIADKNVFGLVADGTGSTGGINMTITDSVSSGNSQDGIIAVTPSGGAPIGVLVTNSKSVNSNIGIRAIGPNVTVRVKNSDIAGNGTGLGHSNGGALLTFGNNAVRANGSDGAFSGSVALQ